MKLTGGHWKGIYREVSSQHKPLFPMVKFFFIFPRLFREKLINIKLKQITDYEKVS